jgi:plasmid stabilization system protein ParE
VRTRRFLPGAEAEFLRAISWHARKRPGLGDEFVSEVEEAVQRALCAPETGSPHLFGTRRLIVDRFHYDIVYVPREQVVLIVSVSHQRRKPGYWRNRLKDIEREEAP